MTLIDLIKLGVIRTDARAEEAAAAIVDSWHEDRVPGELHEVLGVSLREYQAWTTGGVSLLTIAKWQQSSHPPLDVSRPWFKLSGRPGQELVGYLEARSTQKRKLRRKRLGKG